MAESDPMPMIAEDAIEYFKACCAAFASLSTIISAIQDTQDDLLTESLIISGRHIADSFSERANIWREELERGGFKN